MKRKVVGRYDVCIIGGAGHVGLPLGVRFALAGFTTALFDINKASVALINKGKFPFKEQGGDAALRQALRKKKLTALVGPPSVISKSNIIVLVIGTPVERPCCAA